MFGHLKKVTNSIGAERAAVSIIVMSSSIVNLIIIVLIGDFLIFFLSFGEFIFISVEKFGILCYQYTFVNGVLTFTAMELVQDCNLEKNAQV